MINREDMMELTRRMTPKRTSITRIAGSYMDSDGEIDGTFNTNFLKLKTAEKEKNLKLAKTIPYAKTNVNLIRYKFPKESMKQGSMWQLLIGMKACGLKNDVLMETFYDLVAKSYQSKEDYAVLVYHDCYDIPMKATDLERLWDSEEVFEYIICAICPLKEEYEPAKPECGFLFPAYSDRSAEEEQIDIFHANPEQPHLELIKLLGLA